MAFRDWIFGSSDRDKATRQFEEGLRLGRKGNWQEAASRFFKALELRPSFIEARIARADACFLLQDWDEAISEFSRVLSEKPHLIKALVGRAATYASKAADIAERYQKAAGKQFQLSFEELIMPADKLLRSVAPDKAMWIRTTHALMELQCAARKDAEEVIRIEPQNTIARELLQNLNR